MAKQKYYVVWRGVKPGIYSSWDECKAQVHGFEKAQYKAFPSLEMAQKAFSDNPWKYFETKHEKKDKSVFISSSNIIKDSLSVDAASSGNPGRMEYRGVYTADGTEIFHMGPFEEGTNNIGEFLAIVHGLALLKQKGSNLPIYSDSVNAIKWVKQKKANTKLERTRNNIQVFELIARAEKWLQENTYTTTILKWETKSWGEIPADFGRK